MEQFINTVLASLLGGGPGAITALYIAAITFLVWDRKRLHELISKKDDKLEKIVDDYYRGNSTLSEALNGLKSILDDIKSNFKG